MRSDAIPRCSSYSLHGPVSSVCVWPEQRRVTYAGNFSAQLPAVIRAKIRGDSRWAVTTASLSHLLQRVADKVDNPAERDAPED